MGAERFGIRPLTEEEKRRGLKALEEAKRLRAELLARRGGKPFSDSTEMLHDLRDERTQQLDCGGQEQCLRGCERGS